MLMLQKTEVHWTVTMKIYESYLMEKFHKIKDPVPSEWITVLNIRRDQSPLLHTNGARIVGQGTSKVCSVLFIISNNKCPSINYSLYMKRTKTLCTLL